MLKIEFTRATNLAKYAIDNAYTLGVNAYLCDRPGNGNWPGQDFTGLSFSALYWQGHRLSWIEPDPISRRRGADARPITYYFFANVANKETQWLNEPAEGFDPFRDPRDVCFNVGGGNSSGFGYRSNTVVIPKNVVAAAALHKRPPGLGG